MQRWEHSWLTWTVDAFGKHDSVSWKTAGGTAQEVWSKSGGPDYHWEGVRARHDFISHLGAEGWEAFAIGDRTWYFKRPMA